MSRRRDCNFSDDAPLSRVPCLNLEAKLIALPDNRSLVASGKLFVILIMHVINYMQNYLSTLLCVSLVVRRLTAHTHRSAVISLTRTRPQHEMSTVRVYKVAAWM